jgi:hypothetical protein
VYQPLHGGAHYQLFDLETDPACQHNRVDEEPERVAALKQQLLGWINKNAAQNEALTIRK